MTELEHKAVKQSLAYNRKYSEDRDLENVLKHPEEYVDSYAYTMNIVQMLRQKAYRDGYNARAKENGIQWHKQSDTDDIFDACNTDWDIHYFVCKMKNGSYNIAFGHCDEDCNGGISTDIYFAYKDSEYYLDDIIAWIEIPKFKEEE